MKILAQEVESLQGFFGSPLSTQKVCEMKVGKNDAGLIRLLRVWQTGGSSPMTFLTYDVQEKPVGLKAVRSRHMLLTRITHSAVSWLGLQGR